MNSLVTSNKRRKMMRSPNGIGPLVTATRRRQTMRSTIITVILTLLFAYLLVEGGFYYKYLGIYHKYLGHSQVQEPSVVPAVTSTPQIIGSVCQGIKSGITRRAMEYGMSVDDFYGYVLRPTPVQGRPDEMIKAFVSVVWCEYNEQLHKAILSRIAHLQTTNADDVLTTYEVGPTSSRTQSLKSCAEGLEPFSDSPNSLTAVCTGVLYASQHGVYGLQIWVSDREALVRNGALRLFLNEADVEKLVGRRVDKNIGQQRAAVVVREPSTP